MTAKGRADEVVGADVARKHDFSDAINKLYVENSLLPPKFNRNKSKNIN